MKISDHLNDWAAPIAAGVISAILIDDALMWVWPIFQTTENPGGGAEIFATLWGHLIRLTAFVAGTFLFRKIFD